MKPAFSFIFSILRGIILLLLGGSLMFPAPLPAQAEDGDFTWATGFGQTADDEGYDIFVDAAGNVFTTGYFRGTVDFDPGPGTLALTSAANSRDIFISKLDSGGNLVWAKAIGGVSNDMGWGIFADASGNVYTTGDFVGTVDFDPGAATAPLTSLGSSDIFISKLDSNGNFAGAWSMGGNADDYGYGIFLDAAGNIYTTGYFKNTADFNPAAGVEYPLTSASIGVQDIFISKLDNGGNFLWAKAIGGTAADVGLGISLLSTGNVYITGWFQGTVDFNPDAGSMFNLTSRGGSYDVYVCKLDSDGNLVWARAMGGTSEDIGQAVSVDSSGNVYTTGWFNDRADFDPGAGTTFNLTSTGIASDIFISKLDSNGNFVWAKSMGGASAADVGYGIAVDPAGNVYTTGGFSAAADFDPGAGTFLLTSAGNEDIFISKLDSSGLFVWAKAMGGPLADYGYDIAVSSAGAVHATGFFQGTADFNPGPGTFNLVSAGFEDIFICRLAGPDPVGDAAFPWVLFLPAITGKARVQP
jgi:hypothetical protein